MNPTTTSTALHVSDEQRLERSRWFGPNLLTFLTTAEETGGAFTLIKCVMRRGFEPPMHVHTKEEESYFILEGEVMYDAGDKKIHARPGDFVQLKRSVPHRFSMITETATFLLIITPSGFEEMFFQFSQPAQALELPPLPTGRPGKEFFDRMNEVNTRLGVTMLPNL